MQAIKESRLSRPFDLPDTITAPRTDPIYNCHAYLTKVPIQGIRPFLEAFSRPGDVVVDFFAGSGMTGLAALSAGRNAKLSDISALGQHIANGYLQNVSANDLRAAGERAMLRARKAIGNLYTTKRASDGEVQEMIRTVWSFTYICPTCNAEIIFYDLLEKKGSAVQKCLACATKFSKRQWKQSKDVPITVVVNGEHGRQVNQPVSDIDMNAIKLGASDSRLAQVPSLEIKPDREMYSRSGLGKRGLTQTSMFFSPRNAIALLELWRAINAEQDVRVRRKLRFAFTAILPRASRRYQWSAQRPLNAQNQTYYIAPVYYEWNVFDLYNRKINAAIAATDELYGSQNTACDSRITVTYELASADNLQHLADESVDYVFTDPPFGSNIFYSDMNLFHEAWLGAITDHESEAVVHTTGKHRGGAEARYERLLQKAFEEASRILKPGKFMSVVFGNSSGRIWGLVQRALRNAGFKSVPVHVAILDKGQRSVKGLNSGSEGVVTVDLVLTVQKPAENDTPERTSAPVPTDKEALIRDAIGSLSTEDVRNPSHLYARILRDAIRKHLLLDDLHLGEVLIALRNAGFSIDRKTSALTVPSSEDAAA
jgi:16S rRNA G966 N2-methylase RsmD